MSFARRQKKIRRNKEMTLKGQVSQADQLIDSLPFLSVGGLTSGADVLDLAHVVAATAGDWDVAGAAQAVADRNKAGK
jgi:hypothetical protein